MWYVIQVHTGKEEKVCQQCEKLIDSSVLERCFIPRFQKQKRFLGEWHMQNEILFPGYVFLVTEQLDELVDSLKQVNGMVMKLHHYLNRKSPCCRRWAMRSRKWKCL